MMHTVNYKPERRPEKGFAKLARWEVGLDGTRYNNGIPYEVWDIVETFNNREEAYRFCNYMNGGAGGSIPMQLITSNKKLLTNYRIYERLNMELKELKEYEVHNLFQTEPNYEPIGLFWTKDAQFYTGIDNRTGDAWTESFETKEAMLRWFEGWEDGDDETTCPVCGTYELMQLKSGFFKCSKCKCKWDEDVRRRADIL